MRKYRRLVLASMATFAIQKTVSAQSNFAILEKNLNFRASDLIHELNETKDSLILKGSDKIRYVYSINDKYLREIDTYAGRKDFKVAINGLSPGKHVMVVSHLAKLVVFVLKVIRDEPELIAAKLENLVTQED
ncbi:hypothetical protein SAMN03097699_1596 [Flavobacteriaceae bacterium MAR_2010_188]|nr:hypothetical protein SAMN03097699_1596 [Flavobacteriaceae bacterium MAR_2010_188]